MVGAPLGFLLSLVGVFVDRNKKPALFGLGVAVVLCGLFFVVALCQ